MKTIFRLSISRMTLFLTAIALISGCSGSREDVRITFCKDLTSALLDFPPALAWRGNQNRFQRPEYVAVKVLYEMPEEPDGEAICFYDYDTVDENVMTHSQPLSAYSTLPYQVEMNGEPVAKSVLDHAIQSQQVKLVDTLVNRLIQRFYAVVEQLGNGGEKDKLLNSAARDQ